MKTAQQNRSGWISASSRRFWRPAVALLAIAASFTPSGLQAQAPIYYWDSNGATAGAGSSPDGTWGVDAFWSTHASGITETANTTITSADDVYFSAGSDVAGPYEVTLDGTQNVRRVLGKNGDLTLSGGLLVLANSTGLESLWSLSPGNLTVDSTLQVTNSTVGTNYFNVRASADSTITVNGTVTASATNKIIIRQADPGTVVFRSDLGSNAAFLAGLQAGGLEGAAGTVTLAGPQNLGTTSILINVASRNGTVNLGETVDTNTQVNMGAITIGETSTDLTGATINVNSAVDVGSKNITIRSNGTLNVAGSLKTTGITILGNKGDTYQGGTLKILNGGTAELNSFQIRGGTQLISAGTLTGGTMTFGDGTTSGALVLGDATGVGTATLTRLDISGTGTDNRIIGGNSDISTLVLNNSSNNSFGGRLGGDGVNENNLELIKGSTGVLTLTTQNTYVGNTTILSGTLALGVDGSIEDSPVINIGTAGSQGIFDVSAKSGFAFGSGQTLAGYGTINIGTGKVVSFASGSTLAPGNSPGIVSVTGGLALDSGSATQMEIVGRNGGAPVAGTDFDQVVVSEGIVFGGALNIDTTGLSGLVAGDSFELFSAASYTSGFDSIVMTGSYASTFTNNSGVWTGSDQGLEFTFFEATGTFTVTGAIPEPSASAVLAGLGVLGLVAHRRRRRAS